VYFFEAGHEQVKPVWLDGSLDELGAEVWLKKLDNNPTFGKNLIREMLDIIELEKRIARSIPDKAFSPKELEKYLLKHLQYWVKYFAIGFLWFATEPIRIDTNKEIEKIWKGTKEELRTFLDSVYRPMKFPPSSIEQRELLKLVPLKSEALNRALRRHTRKYHHLSLHNIDDEFFDLQYYLNRVKTFQESEKDYKETQEIIDSADHEAKHATETIQKAKLPSWIKNRINFIRWFMYIRTTSIDYMMMVNGAFVFDPDSVGFELNPECLDLNEEGIKNILDTSEKLYERMDKDNEVVLFVTSPNFRAYSSMLLMRDYLKRRGVAVLNKTMKIKNLGQIKVKKESEGRKISNTDFIKADQEFRKEKPENAIMPPDEAHEAIAMRLGIKMSDMFAEDYDDINLRFEHFMRHMINICNYFNEDTKARSQETRDAFLLGHGGQVEIMLEPILEIGSEEFFQEMNNPAYTEAWQGGMCYFDALLRAHSLERVNGWMRRVRTSLDYMLSQIRDGEMAGYVGHSPLIELAIASTFPDVYSIPAYLHEVGRMSGTLFVQKKNGVLTFKRYLLPLDELMGEEC